MLHDLSEKVGVPVPTLKLAVLFFASYPVALGFRQIPRSSRILREAYTFAFAIAFFLFAFDWRGLLETILTALFTYFLTAKFGRAKWVPCTIFIGTMLQLAAKHFAAQVVDGNNNDHTGPLMVLVIKLSSFAWSTYDGHMDPAKLSKSQEMRVIRKFPDLLEFLSYIFDFTTFMAGPAIEFREYQMFMHNEAPFDNAPSPFLPALFNLAQAVGSMLVLVLFGSSWHYSFMLTKEFKENYSVLGKLLFFYVAAFVTRTRYYTAWKFPEGATVLTGLGYNGQDPRSKRHDWTRGQNMSFIHLELAENCRMFVQYWNIHTQKWLQNHVYLRFIRADGKNAGLVTVLVFMTSAFWHGFHPGFYLAFFEFAMLTVTGRLARRYFRPFFMPKSPLSRFKPIYDLLGVVVTVNFFNFGSIPFVLLTIPDTLAAWRVLWFFPIWIMAATYIFLQVLGGGRVLLKTARSLGYIDEKKEEVVESSEKKKKKN